MAAATSAHQADARRRERGAPGIRRVKTARHTPRDRCDGDPDRAGDPRHRHVILKADEGRRVPHEMPGRLEITQSSCEAPSRPFAMSRPPWTTTSVTVVAMPVRTSHSIPARWTGRLAQSCHSQPSGTATSGSAANQLAAPAARCRPTTARRIRPSPPVPPAPPPSSSPSTGRRRHVARVATGRPARGPAPARVATAPHSDRGTGRAAPRQAWPATSDATSHTAPRATASRRATRRTRTRARSEAMHGVATATLSRDGSRQIRKRDRDRRHRRVLSCRARGVRPGRRRGRARLFATRRGPGAQARASRRAPPRTPGRSQSCGAGTARSSPRASHAIVAAPRRCRLTLDRAPCQRDRRGGEQAQGTGWRRDSPRARRPARSARRCRPGESSGSRRCGQWRGSRGFSGAW